MSILCHPGYGDPANFGSWSGTTCSHDNPNHPARLYQQFPHLADTLPVTRRDLELRLADLEARLARLEAAE